MIEQLEDAFLATQNLDGDTIAQIRVISTTPKPTARRPVRKPKTTVAEEDVTMDEVRDKSQPGPEQVTPKPAQKGKGRARSAGSESAISATQESESLDVAGAGSKRMLQDSPTRVEVRPKRSRTVKKVPPALSEDGIDLSGHTFDEDSRIDASLVPRVEGKVRLR